MSSLPRRRFLQYSTALASGLVWPGRSMPSQGAAVPDVPVAPFAYDLARLNDNIIPAPEDAADWPAFRQILHQWRASTRERLKYDDALYRREDFAWVPSSFACCFLMMCDELFYGASGYTLERLLDHGQREFGGFDSIVLWHAYPRIGLDDRNQFDFYRDMPGGLAGLRKISDTCHRRGVRVYIDYNPWDTGTRREGKGDIDALVEAVAAIDADGIFLDTMNRGAAEFRKKLDAVRAGVVLEGEIALPLENVHDHHMSWAQGFRDSRVPGVLRNKWFERRHLQHQIDRWNRDHSAELHTAWMNGSGIMVWENVFGSWVGWNSRDKSILRSMLPIQRRYWRLFCGEGWTPLVPTLARDVYASLWEGEGLRLWTLVNRSEAPIEGDVLEATAALDQRVFDLVAGREVGGRRAEKVILSGRIPPRGIAAFLVGPEPALGSDFANFLEEQAAVGAAYDGSTRFQTLSALLKEPVPTRSYAPGDIPPGMVAIPATTLVMKSEFRSRECGFYNSQEPSGNPHPIHQPRIIDRKVALRPYAIDLCPVTNARFAEFVRATRYKPAHPENFLKHWQGGGIPSGLEEHPVVYVALEDARAYARWAGKRLVREEEWQYAAQGPQALRYPWGNEFDRERCNGGQTGTTTSVTAFPAGRSPSGCYDMCGNTWEWTESERRDGRTRFCILKGGSYYTARGSDWYFDGGPRSCAFAAKMLLMWSGLDRCATVGFRCAVDLG